MADTKSESVAVDAGSNSSQASNPLSRKINKILDTRLDNDKELLESLRSLSSILPENSLRARRDLRGDIERRHLAIGEDFLRLFCDVKDALEDVTTDVEAMNKACQDMSNCLKATKEETQGLISKTTKLQAEGRMLAVQAQVAAAFLAKFQLQPKEEQALREPVTQEFFDALDRVKAIHDDVKILLRSNQQTAGLEIMEQMALHEEAAYERLYRWAQSDCRGLTRDSCDVSPILIRALACLQPRPVLFKYVIDEYGAARRSAVVRCFIEALTRGGASGTPRPIEMHCHDPLRYVGDMLAWLHQAIATEHEQLEALLSAAPGNETMSQEVLGHITEGVCRPLKVRIEQVLVAQPGAVLLFRLSNVLKFYQQTIGGIVGDQAADLLVTLAEMEHLGRQVFLSTLAQHAGSMLDKVDTPSADLSPPALVNQTLTLLRELLTSQDAWVVPLDDRQAHFSQVLSCVLDPLLQMVSLEAGELQRPAMATFLVNCLHRVHGALTPHEVSDERLDNLQLQIDAHLDTLVSENASFVLSSAGLGSIYAFLQQRKGSQAPLSEEPTLDVSSVKTAMMQFDRYLSSPDHLILPQLDLLLSATLREKVKKRSAEVICDAYEDVYTALTAPAQADGNLAAVIPRTSAQVRGLLL
uniref:conserved oligomeric Golgi complex subunit 6 isoform X1 n=2 Tax=Myxine glutinosa TaxID=7769 RepID=UPI00358F324D